MKADEMALQMTPLAWLAVRYGATAAAGFAAARFARPGRFSPAVEAQMDAAPDGMQLRRAPGQIAASGKLTRNWRFGPIGPRFRIDGTALARLRVRRLN